MTVFWQHSLLSPLQFSTRRKMAETQYAQCLVLGTRHDPHLVFLLNKTSAGLFETVIPLAQLPFCTCSLEPWDFICFLLFSLLHSFPPVWHQSLKLFSLRGSPFTEPPSAPALLSLRNKKSRLYSVESINMRFVFTCKVYLGGKKNIWFPLISCRMFRCIGNHFFQFQNRITPKPTAMHFNISQHIPRPSIYPCFGLLSPSQCQVLPSAGLFTPMSFI